MRSTLRHDRVISSQKHKSSKAILSETQSGHASFAHIAKTFCSIG